MQLQDLFNRFAEYMVHERNFAPLTVKAYSQDLEQFVLYLGEQGIEPTVAAADEINLRGFIVWLSKHGRKARTINRKMHAIAAFVRWAIAYDYLEVNPMARIILPAEEENLPRYLPADDVRRMALAPFLFPSPIQRFRGLELRDEIAFKLLAWLDLSQTALLALNVGDVNLDTRAVYLKGKIVRIPKALIPTIHEYLGNYAAPARPFLTSYLGGWWSRKYYRKAFWRHVETCGLDYQGPGTHPRDLPSGQREIFLATAIRPYTASGNVDMAFRDWLIVALFAWLGLRRGEVEQLNVSSIRLKDWTILVEGKGRRQRLLPLPDELIEVLAEFVRGRQPDDPLFMSRKGERLQGKALTKAVKRQAARCGLDPDEVYPHILRHSFATHLVRGEVPLAKVSALMGHADPRTTMQYTQLDTEGLRRAFDVHPLRRSTAITEDMQGG